MIAFREQFTPDSDLVEPWVNLAIAILETTIQDIHILRRAGLLVDGETKRPWPIARGWKPGDTNKQMRASNHYNHPRTVDELIALGHNIPYEDWLLDLCRSMSLIEAEMFWRWALEYRWSSVRYRMVKWLKIRLGMSDISNYNPEMLIQMVFTGIGRDKLAEEMFVPLRPYTNNKLGLVGTSSKYCFVTDCSLSFIHI